MNTDTEPNQSSLERPNADHPDRYKPRKKWLPDRPHKAYPGGPDADAFADESLYKPSLLGSAIVEPAEICAGATSEMLISYTTGEIELPEGTSVFFGVRGQSPLGYQKGEIQLSYPSHVEIERRGWGFLVQKGTLITGDRITLQFPPFPFTPIAGAKQMKVTFQIPGCEAELRLPEPLTINVAPDMAASLQVLAPATHRLPDIIPVEISMRDRFDNPVNVNADIVVDEGARVSLVNGKARAFVTQSGQITRVHARLEGTSIEADSNPSLKSDDYQLYIGDLHCHDFLSEAEGYPDDVYRWARDEKRLDFVSITPQSHGWHDNETWTLTKYMNERFLDEGRFVTFLGFEWQHTGYGDKIVHYLGGDQPYLPADDPRYSHPAKLYAALRQSDAFIISHHISYKPGDWCPATDAGVIEEDIERVIEIWSMHGSSEGFDLTDRPLHNMDPDYTAYQALKKGKRIGFIAGSDSHSGRPGGSAKEPLGYWGGLAAVWAKDLTRRSLFEAIRDRRTYALMQSRIILKMLVNDAWMGSELPYSETASIQVEAWGEASIECVQIMKNAELLKEYGPFGDNCCIHLEDVCNGPAFYHCRIVQSDGQLAVCSPVWIG